MKKLLLTCCLWAVSLAIYAEDRWIDFHVGYNNPTNVNKGKTRTPIQPPAVYLKNYTLSFNAFEEDCTIQLLSEDDGIVVSDVIPAGTSTFQLPTYLVGEYQIQLIYGNFIFTGYIEL